jgi:hypothetical protein
MGHIMDDYEAFAAWRATLAKNQREQWNLPRIMWRRFAAARKSVPKNAVAKPQARAKAVELKVENELLKAKLAKVQDGQLLVDLAHDDSATIVRALVHDPAAKRNPKNVARLYRMAADQLDPPV